MSSVPQLTATQPAAASPAAAPPAAAPPAAASAAAAPPAAIGPIAKGGGPRHAAAPPRAALVAASIAVTVLWAAALWFTPHVHVDGPLRRLVLFGHLASLVVGFGAVLTVDWFGLLWVVRRRSMLTVVQTAHGAHTLIWIGLLGLLATGMPLSPDLSAPLTMVKLVAVLGVALNGLRIVRVQRRMATLGDRRPPPDLLRQAVLAVTVSQVCWWTAMAIGFLNAPQ